MKFQILIELIFMLLNKKIVTVNEIASRFEISRSTVFRYVDELTLASIPIAVKHGRNGGFYVPEDYKLRYGYFTKKETELLKQAIYNIEFTKTADSPTDTQDSAENERLKRSLTEKLSVFAKD